jgi:acyl carrier protein
LVIAGRALGSQKQLVSYVVFEPHQGVTDAELRRHVAEHLPDYMVPDAFVILAELPRSAHGKVDLRALPMPGSKSMSDEYVAPQGTLEREVCVVWAEALGLEQVGMNDNFFQLGGHSLLATQVIARIRDIFGVELSMRALFDSPVLGDFARRLEEAKS